VNDRLPGNPFVGLRPFQSEEALLFFGRRQQTTALLERLQVSHFVAVIGSSGCGKSSFVRAGLIPRLEGGFLVENRDRWTFVTITPGDAPLARLAAEFGIPEDELRESSAKRVVQQLRSQPAASDRNCFILVDQFEELFRFRSSGCYKNEDAEDFVDMLMSLAEQREFPVFVGITMRSDFLGDCDVFPGLPEALNRSQYLMPRLTRQQRRESIEGPVRLCGETITPRLVDRLLNDAGDESDQLPVLQHALMRTWDHWRPRHQPGEPIDLEHYEAIGTMRQALSLHAEEAYADADTDSRRKVVERMFKALTDTFLDPRGIRRPASLHELSAICEVTETEVAATVELFRRPGRSFLMPPSNIPLESGTVVDISHESLMRRWDRLIQWAREERSSADRYLRLSRAAAWHEDGTAGLWRDPELELGLRWRKLNCPSAAWAARYDPFFDRAMAFLDRSREAHERDLAEREREGQRKLRRLQLAVVALVAFLVVAGVLVGIGIFERNRAETNLQTAKNIAQQFIGLAGGESRVLPDAPEIELFRNNMLKEAREVYLLVAKQKPGEEESRSYLATAEVLSGDIARIQQVDETAILHYKSAIESLSALAREYFRNPEYRRELASAYNWLGESQRVLPDHQAEAQDSYDNALRLQEGLYKDYSNMPDYQRELARTHYNRGILWFALNRPDLAEADYREAIRLLEPLSEITPARQELARAFNNFAILLKAQGKTNDARRYRERAIAIHEALVKQFPGNRDYALELAVFYENFGLFLANQKEFDLAVHNNEKAIALFEDLASPAPTFAMNIAYAHTLRGRILQTKGDSELAGKEYQKAIDMFERLGSSKESQKRADFHLWYGDSLMSLGNLQYTAKQFNSTIKLLSQAVEQHASARSKENLCYDYNLLEKSYLAAGSTGEAARIRTRRMDILCRDAY
jgi:tetratricopeptide (TPR) repeat protein/ABC-type oligopeptide transport system ATPase subunit